MSSGNGTNGKRDIVALFKKAAFEVDNKKFDDLKLETSISELGLDSVAMLELIGYIEEELNVHFPDEDLARLQTLQDLSDLITKVSPAN
ncbi:MAG TPA: acyl carrier protein [Myxococcota bacterium]|nr:acyl carrier protein [Myxococcota bacterium]